jgi:AraC-like DNA-binding protein
MKPILRKIDTGDQHSFSVREDRLPHLYHHWHYHPELELTLIRKGSGMRLVGDHIEPFDDGDLILLGANLPHLWRSAPAYFEEGSGIHIEAIAIHFKANCFGDAFLHLPELAAIRGLFAGARRGLRITGATRVVVAAKMEQLLAASGTVRIAGLIQILDCIAASGHYKDLASLGFTHQYVPGRTDKINHIYNYTLAHFHEKITIVQVAEAANMSRHSFCRYFKTHTLKTYSHFLTEVRIGCACRLLIENKLGVAAIADASGFYNLSNFNRQFKARFNTSPLQYRKAYNQSV